MALYAVTRQKLFEDERRLLDNWIRRKAFLMAMISFHGRRAMVVKIVDEAEIAKAVVNAAVAAKTEDAIKRVSARESLWRMKRDDVEQEIKSKTCSSCSGGGVIGSVISNSDCHSRNIAEVFTRWTIFVNITSFL